MESQVFSWFHRFIADCMGRRPVPVSEPPFEDCPPTVTTLDKLKAARLSRERAAVKHVPEEGAEAPSEQGGGLSETMRPVLSRQSSYILRTALEKQKEARNKRKKGD